ncbi:hypothetical protein ABB37_00345 [Leptomonas pyrrhocoris]|uniref:Uncharacterized protein n=1 Tax=Leptomonas pyrrhocoris TaxID=157538 RepID=A0A0N0VHU3_LEPPY|nr:hypothetical protein ABB37_00345 [Leptomonas pyrrhocoris]KPA86078.1 hypothetical protein ABB37_00345 [Leptomonas pyrrhocoris]|eukprot:XP_015664517.1 hypothetical protein ABB37_00345 [Leptomonas pyrrhocoris]
MRRLLSRENFADFAQQAAGALRRLVSSSDGWNSRDALSSSSKVVLTACKTNSRVDTCTLEAWVDDLVTELELQSASTGAASPAGSVGPSAKESAEKPGSPVATSPTTSNSPESSAASPAKAKNDTWKPLSESALMANLEVARVLVFSVNAKEAGMAYHEKKLVHVLVQYYQNPTLSQKLRDCCALVVVGVCSSQNELLRDCLRACKDTLRDSPQDYTGRVLRVLLASLLVEVLHQFHISGDVGVVEELDERSTAYCKSLIDSLFHEACQLQQPAPTPPLISAVVSPRTVASSKGETEVTKAAATATAPLTGFPAAQPLPPAAPASAASPTIALPPLLPTSATSTSASTAAADAASPVSSAVAGEGANAETAVHDSLTVAASAVFLAVINGVYRGRSGLKAYFLQTYGAEYAQLWATLASRLSQMPTTLQLSLGPSRTVPTATLEPVEYWRSELLEGLVELCTEDSFTYQRAIVMVALSGACTNGSTTSAGASATVSGTATSARRVAQRSFGSSSTAAAAPGCYQYDPVPVDWEVYLSSGSPSMWQLASALYVCAITADGADVLKAVLLQLNTKYASAETLYRWIICTLTLLCVANPRNAVLLSEHNMLRTLIALINCNQSSVFPSSEEVTLWSRAREQAGAVEEAKEGEESKKAVPTPSSSSSLTSPSAVVVAAAAASKQVTMVLTPPNTLNVNTTQLTFCFLDTLTSTTFSKNTVKMVCNGIKDMYSVASSQTDVDVVENVLCGLCKAFIPRRLLFFPGDGYVTWRLKQIFPRGSGYSFSAWIFPTCVWGGGSCLYSFMDQGDTRVSLLVVADGRLCSLAVRVNKAGGDPLELVMSDGNFAASQWTYVVVTQGVALNVYINGRRLESVHDVPYPREKHSLTFTMGGAPQLPGFFGYTSGMNISPALSEKDIARLYAAGPTLYEPTKDCASVLAPCFEEESGGDTQPSSATSSLQRHEVLAKRSSEFSWHRVELYTPTDIEETIIPKRVLEWVLSVLKARETATIRSTSAFMNVAKLCLSLLTTSMQLASNEDLTALVRKNHLERLRTEVLSWQTTFPEFGSLLLQSVTVRGSGRVLRAHACTQCVFDILLSCVMQTSERNKELISHSRGSTHTNDDSVTRSSSQPPSPPPPLLPNLSTHEANSTNIILRELSDCLLVKENLKLFQEDPKRFQSILNLTLHLPKECIKSVVILIEKLCRGEAELRQVFLFLFAPSSLSPTADTAKVRVLRMLFDIAQEDVAMCEMIQECCKGRGFAFLLLLVSGENHSSEAIRVLAIGLLSLLMPLKSCAKFFRKSDGFDVLAMSITEPRSPIPLGIRTFDALIQVAFDEFRRRKEKRPETDGIAVRLMAAAHLSHRSRQRESSAATAVAALPRAVASGLPPGRPPRRTFEFRGHAPAITVNQLGTRRGYSFEHTHDYGKVNEDFGELMILHKGNRYHSLELPLALKAVLCALDFFIQALVRRLPSPSSTSSSSNTRRVPSGDPPSVASANNAVSPLPRPESGPFQATSASSSPSLIVNDEKVVIEVLNYLSKVIDYPKHALKLMDIQWLGGLWVAVRVFFEKPADSAGSSAPRVPSFVGDEAAASASVTSPAVGRDFAATGMQRLHQDRSDFVYEVRQQTCTIIRKMVILDIVSNERAQVRSIRDGDYPPRLVRIVLEEIARYFCVQKNGELVENANNVIRNLNFIFKDVHTALHPFPPNLGVAIVMAITNISVSSSMQVRRRMKNSSNLLTIRDNLAFFVLRESRRFLQLRKRSLNQLIDINVNNANSMTVLLYHLSNSIKENSVNEVEVLVSLIQQLACADSARLRELHNLVGESREVMELQELLSSTSGGVFASTASPLQPALYPSLPTPSDRAMSEAFTDLDSNAGGNADRPHWSSGHGVGLNPLETDAEPSAGAFTVQLLDWCQAHPEAWAAVQKNIQSAISSQGLDRKDEKKDERGALFNGSGGVGGLSPKVSSGGATGVGYSERSRKEFQQVCADVEEELAKSTWASAATAAPQGAVSH